MQASPVRDLVVGIFVASGLATIAYLSIQVAETDHQGAKLQFLVDAREKRQWNV
jgi:hypothetical protein